MGNLQADSGTGYPALKKKCLTKNGILRIIGVKTTGAVFMTEMTPN